MAGNTKKLRLKYWGLYSDYFYGRWGWGEYQTHKNNSNNCLKPSEFLKLITHFPLHALLLSFQELGDSDLFMLILLWMCFMCITKWVCLGWGLFLQSKWFLFISKLILPKKTLGFSLYLLPLLPGECKCSPELDSFTHPPFWLSRCHKSFSVFQNCSCQARQASAAKYHSCLWFLLTVQTLYLLPFKGKGYGRKTLWLWLCRIKLDSYLVLTPNPTSCPHRKNSVPGLEVLSARASWPSWG